MKKWKTLLPLFLVGGILFFTSCSKDDDDNDDSSGGTTFLAPTDPMNRNAVLEDFTGVRCGFCPDGHAIAQSMMDANPERVVVIGVNAGSYANPVPGWADFTTPYGQALINQSAVAGYPAGTVNRLQYGSGQAGGLAMSRGSWNAAAQAVMQMPSPVNIGASASYNASNRELTVKVDLYYTSEETVTNNINVAFLQSGMVANQSGGGGSYVHKHVLRDLITGQWGDEVTEATTEGARISKTYTYTVPEDYNGPVIPPGGGEVVIGDCEVAVFVSRGNVDVLTGIKVDIQ